MSGRYCNSIVSSESNSSFDNAQYVMISKGGDLDFRDEAPTDIMSEVDDEPCRTEDLSANENEAIPINDWNENLSTSFLMPAMARTRQFVEASRAPIDPPIPLYSSLNKRAFHTYTIVSSDDYYSAGAVSFYVFGAEDPIAAEILLKILESYSRSRSPGSKPAQLLWYNNGIFKTLKDSDAFMARDKVLYVDVEPEHSPQPVFIYYYGCGQKPRVPDIEANKALTVLEKSGAVGRAGVVVIPVAYGILDPSAFSCQGIMLTPGAPTIEIDMVNDTKAKAPIPIEKLHIVDYNDLAHVRPQQVVFLREVNANRQRMKELGFSILTGILGFALISVFLLAVWSTSFGSRNSDGTRYLDLRHSVTAKGPLSISLDTFQKITTLSSTLSRPTPKHIEKFSSEPQVGLHSAYGAFLERVDEHMVTALTYLADVKRTVQTYSNSLEQIMLLLFFKMKTYLVRNLHFEKVRGSPNLAARIKHYFATFRELVP